MPLRMASITIAAANLSVAPVPPKTADPRYATPEWRALRARVLKRDRWTCVVEGCGARACVVDHVVSPKNGGADVEGNLRSLCRTHDNQIKEDASGTRRGGGRFKART